MSCHSHEILALPNPSTFRKRISIAFFWMVLLWPAMMYSQQTDTLLHKLDSLEIKADTLQTSKQNNIAPENYDQSNRLTPKTYFILLASDLKQQLTLPFKARKRDLIQVGELGLVTIGLSFADKPISRYAVGIRERSAPISSISTYVTRFGGLYEGYTLAALGLYGLAAKNQKLQTTTLLATQAYITGSIISTGLKFLTGRQRPVYISPVTSQNASTFHGPFYQFKKDASGNKPDNATFSSFPSGHTTVAFAAATVFAFEYRDKPIVPIIAYSAATLIGFSRITEKKHWPTDVLIGAALGYLSGRQVVNNFHRFSKIKKATTKNSGKLTPNINYVNGTIMPGLTYRFR